ncbi:unnamed protein product, partial [Eruca vesicaria subsp. sativa]|nr:unnamed protein product [Eruca vesicaria subsp. sativa]
MRWMKKMTRGGPRQKVHFDSDEVHACTVTCGGLDTVIEKSGFYAKNTVFLNSEVVNNIHKRGGTILGTSRGGHDTTKIFDRIQDRGINQVYIIGGDGTHRGAPVIYIYNILGDQKAWWLKVVVVGIPKIVNNDFPVIDRSFGFDTAVEESQRAINAAHVEAESDENGIGFVKLMGRYSGFRVMYATLASRDVECCLIPESPFYLEGECGLLEFIERRINENGHMVIVLAEGAGQDLMSKSMESNTLEDASAHNLLKDVGLWLSQNIKMEMQMNVNQGKLKSENRNMILQSLLLERVVRYLLLKPDLCRMNSNASEWIETHKCIIGEHHEEIHSTK